MEFFVLLSRLAALIPNLLTAIIAVENAFPNAAGSAKLQAVTTALTSASQHATEVIGTAEQIAPPIHSLISGLVGALNDAGIFTHKAAATAAPGDGQAEHPIGG